MNKYKYNPSFFSILYGYLQLFSSLTGGGVSVCAVFNLMLKTIIGKLQVKQRDRSL